jgi:hypothetical protein
MPIESALRKPKSMIDDQCQLATNSETSPAILRELSQSGDRTIRQAVAGNPNVPIEILWELVAEFPNEIVANPLFSLITLENPNWIIDIPGKNFLALLQQANPPKVFIEAALNCIGYDADGHDIDQYGIRPLAVRCIVNNPRTSIEYLEKIVDEHATLYSAIIEHPNFGLESFRRISRCDDWEFQSDLVSFCFSDGEDGRIWPQHVDRKEIIDAVIPELMKSITDENMRVLILLQEVRLPEKFIPELLANLSNNALLYLAKSSHTPIAVLKKMPAIQCTDRNSETYIRKAAVENLQSQLTPQDPKVPKHHQW